MVGDGARALIVRALGTTPNDPRVPGALDAYSSFYLNAPTAFTTRLPGVDELLARLDARCMPCAVVTNKPRGVSLCVLNNLEIARYFRAVWAGGDGPLKPSPAGLIHVATALGADVRDAWMVGDSPQDIEAGRAAGCFTIGVRGFAHAAALEASRPDVLVESLASLMTHV
jgi:phosphoglycolate phosphatase